ncbi:MAG TPA: DUF2851 family protein [Chloroflexota bacterium]|nr:DUF2851 family protein [Chloroflexota bacterium]
MSDSISSEAEHDFEIDERWVVEIWERQAFDRTALSALGLAVVSRGTPSDAGGPDYQDALLLQKDRELLHGDVEVHVRSSDWTRHGHDRDPHYNRVILHVVWIADAAPTLRQDGRPVPTLSLSDCSTMRPLRGNGSVPALLPHPCATAFSRLEGAELTERVAQLGLRRFLGRADRFAAELETLAPDQVIYQGILESLGYASNRDTFRELGEALPYAWLSAVPSDDIAAVLLDAAGLGPPAGWELPARLPPGRWRLARLRPGNRPERRLRGLAIVLRRAECRLADYLSTQTLAATTSAQLRSLVRAGEDGSAYIGSGRADEIVVSVILPFVAAFSAEVERVARVFASYPAPPINRWTRVMCGLARDSGHELRVRKACMHQGLHELYHRHCRYERHDGCPVCGRSAAG